MTSNFIKKRFRKLGYDPHIFSGSVGYIASYEVNFQNWKFSSQGVSLMLSPALGHHSYWLQI